MNHTDRVKLWTDRLTKAENDWVNAEDFSREEIIACKLLVKAREKLLSLKEQEQKMKQCPVCKLKIYAISNVRSDKLGLTQHQVITGHSGKLEDARNVE